MSDDIYRSDPDAAGDSEFHAGELHDLVVGNRGRLLDARRTPVGVTAVDPDTGGFEVEIRAFEDAGVRWELPLHDVKRFQFAIASRIATGAALATLERAAAAFGRELVVEADPQAKEQTLRRIAGERRALRAQLAAATGDIDVAGAITRREGDGRLFAALIDCMSARGLADLEERFGTAFVTNPRSGEFVKGHAVVLAELGMTTYRGQIVRRPDVFAGRFTRARRAEHLVARLAFTQELWSALCPRSVQLYRGMAADGPLGKPPPASFVSATFSREVATAHFEGGPTTKAAVLWRQEIPVNRLVMTFLETPEMNRSFKEAEAVLLADPNALTF